MTAGERYLYHQIHPLKLAIDIASGFGALYPLWQHSWPAMVAGLAIIAIAWMRGILAPFR
jgi:hypothetical protein